MTPREQALSEIVDELTVMIERCPNLYTQWTLRHLRDRVLRLVEKEQTK